ncbi:hypothetical protein XENORESO_021903 [Xenotaenia resolanae]|uniref:Uncharacterized protein n=1 Tax=Xenotaenia resolanae TaxID=208358 RepID=A0ABV0X4Y6_9TELE
MPYQVEQNRVERSRAGKNGPYGESHLEPLFTLTVLTLSVEQNIYRKTCCFLSVIQKNDVMSNNTFITVLYKKISLLPVSLIHAFSAHLRETCSSLLSATE